MRDLNQIVTEIKLICEENPVMQDRITALRQAGFDDIEYRYTKPSKVILPSINHGLLETNEIPRKKLYRIQIGYTEIMKGYPAAWCVDVSSVDVTYVKELPF